MALESVLDQVTEVKKDELIVEAIAGVVKSKSHGYLGYLASNVVCIDFCVEYCIAGYFRCANFCATSYWKYLRFIFTCLGMPVQQS